MKDEERFTRWAIAVDAVIGAGLGIALGWVVARAWWS